MILYFNHASDVDMKGEGTCEVIDIDPLDAYMLIYECGCSLT